MHLILLFALVSFKRALPGVLGVYAAICIFYNAVHTKKLLPKKVLWSGMRPTSPIFSARVRDVPGISGPASEGSYLQPLGLRKSLLT